MKEKKIDFNGKLRPHQAVRVLQDRVASEAKKQTQSRTRTFGRSRGMNA